MRLMLVQELRHELRLRLRQEMRCALVQRQKLNLATATDETDSRHVKHLKRLLKQGVGKRVSVKRRAGGRADELDHSIEELLLYCASNTVEQLITLAIAGPDNGYSPVEFLSEVAAIIQCISERELVDRFVTDVAQWPQEKVFSGIQLVHELLPSVGTPEALSELMCIMSWETTDARLIREASDHIPSLVPRRLLASWELRLLFAIIRDVARLIPTGSWEYWQETQENMVRLFLSTESPEAILGRNPRLPPILVIQFWHMTDQPSFDRWLELATHGDVEKSIDTQRALLNGSLALARWNPFQGGATEIVRHILKVCGSCVELVKVYRQLWAVAVEKRLGRFPFETRTGRELLGELCGDVRSTGLQEIGLTAREISEPNLGIRDPHAIKICDVLIRLISVYRQKKYSGGMELIRRMIERLREDSYRSYRYEHERAGEQLSALGWIDPWRKNLYRAKHVGDISGVESILRALRELAPLLRRQFRDIFQEEDWWSFESLQDVYTASVRAIREARTKADKEDAIRVKNRVSGAYRILQSIGELERLDVDGFLGLPEILGTLRRECGNYSMFQDLIQEVESIYRSSSDLRKRIERIVIQETDDLYDLLNVGMRPVLTCQRWTEPTEYNEALLSFVLDANKKLFLVSVGASMIVARVIVRLLKLPVGEEQCIPMILVERPYSIRWSEEIAYALLQVLIEKAENVASQSAGVCALAFSKNDRSSDLWRILKRKVLEAGMRARTYVGNMKLEPSINAYEYSDALVRGRLIESGETVRANVHVVLVKGGRLE
jgi:hypothetical protein